MKKIISFFLVALMVFSSLVPVSAATGDTIRINPGDSIADALTSIKAGGTLILSEGTYKIDKAITLDSGYKNITIKGEGDVTITAGEEIQYSSFQKCSDTAFLDALVDQSARDKIVSVNLPEIGITEYGSIKPHGNTGPEDPTVDSAKSGYPTTLTYNDKLLTIARYPNNQYAYIENVVNYNSDTDTKYYTNHYKVVFNLKNEDTRYENWNSWGKDEYDRNGIWATAYYYKNWSDTTLPVGKNDDGTLYGFTSKSYYGNEGQRLFFFNIPEELDAPGEWYLNRETGVLYLYPEEGMKNGDTLSFNPKNITLINISESTLADKNITVENIRFSGTCYRGAYVSKCRNVVFDNCEFTAIGSYAVNISSSYNCGVKNSYLHDLGSWGVNFDSCGSRTSLTPSNCFVDNCHFERFSTFRRTYAPAVRMNGGAGTRVSHNEIHNAPHFAISYSGNNHTIEYNEIYNICTDTADAGSIYTGRSWSTRGNEIRYNYFHDMKKNASGDGIRAVYLDDLSSSTKVYGNVFVDVYQVALFAGGRYNQFTNNLLVNCSRSINAQSRGTKWTEDAATGERVSFYNTLRNSLYTDGSSRTSSYFELDAWKAAYPEECETMIADMPVGDARKENGNYENVKLPKYNTIKNNILFNSAAFTIDDNVKTYGLEIEDGYQTSDANIFKNYNPYDYTLDPESAVYLEMATDPDFKDIPFSQMGRTNKEIAVPEKLVVTKDVYTEEFEYDEELDSTLNNLLYNFPKVDVKTTTGGTITAPSIVKSNYSSSYSSKVYNNTYKWKSGSTQFGIMRDMATKSSRNGSLDVSASNPTGNQHFTVNYEVPLNKWGEYSIVYSISNPSDLTDAKLSKPNSTTGINDEYAVKATLTSSSVENSPFTTASSPNATSKELKAYLSSDKSTLTIDLDTSAGFGAWADGGRPNETGNLSAFDLGFYYSVMTYFENMKVIETTRYSGVSFKQTTGGTTKLTGYVMDHNESVKYVSDITVENEGIVLLNDTPATLTLAPEEDTEAVVTYNGAPLVVTDNKITFVPTEGGKLDIKYIYHAPVVTAITAGTPVFQRNYKATVNGETIKSENSIIMYGMFSVAKNKTRKSVGYYVTKLDESGKPVGAPIKLAAEAVTTGDPDSTFAIRIIGSAITIGKYKVKPYLITNDNVELVGEEKLVTIGEAIVFDGVSIDEYRNVPMTTYIIS